VKENLVKMFIDTGEEIYQHEGANNHWWRGPLSYPFPSVRHNPLFPRSRINRGLVQYDRNEY
jgi:hypothetical protein